MYNKACTYDIAVIVKNVQPLRGVCCYGEFHDLGSYSELSKFKSDCYRQVNTMDRWPLRLMYIIYQLSFGQCEGKYMV